LAWLTENSQASLSTQEPGAVLAPPSSVAFAAPVVPAVAVWREVGRMRACWAVQGEEASGRDSFAVRDVVFS
jgi:hypothetical protein